MCICKGEKKDLGNIINIILECSRHMENQGIFQWDGYYPNTDIVEEDIARGDCYVVKDEYNCIAYFAINEEQSEEYSQVNWASNQEKVLVIHRLCVDPNFQGKKIAKTILKYIEEYCNRNGYSCIRLDAYSGNERALRLYENFGCKKMGQVFFPRRELPFYCYEKMLY